MFKISAKEGFEISFLDAVQGKVIQKISLSKQCISIGDKVFGHNEKRLDIRCICDYFLWEYYLRDGEFCRTDAVAETPREIKLILEPENNDTLLDSIKIWLIKMLRQ